MIRAVFASKPHQAAWLVMLIFSGCLGSVVSAAPTSQFEEAQFAASDAIPGQQFGTSIALDGDTLVVGAPLDDRRGENSGSVYIFERLGNTWFETARFSGGESSANDQFGYSVALVEDTLLVGSPYDSDEGFNRGSAYFFQRTRSGWLQTARVLASDAENGDSFGFAVALGGGRAIIGAVLGGTPQIVDSGSAYIFEQNLASWTQTHELLAADAAAGDQFGFDVALTDTWAVVGARWDDDAGSTSGSAYVFERGFSSWGQSAKLTASNARAGDEFGRSVAVWDNQVVVGAPLNDGRCPDGGAGFVFEFGAMGWSETAVLYASDANENDQLACGVSISADGVFLGAWLDGYMDTGSVYRYELANGVWSDTSRYIASNPRNSDYLGCGVAASGALLAAGAPYRDDGGDASGSAYLFSVGSSTPVTRSVFSSSFE